MRRSLSILFAITLSVLASCGGSDSPNYPTNPPPPPVNGNITVEVWTNYYTPDTAKVAAGKSVTWTWVYADGVDHDVVFDDGSVDSGVKTSGSFEHTFSTPGTYTYHCTRHPMTGVLVVE